MAQAVVRIILTEVSKTSEIGATVTTRGPERDLIRFRGRLVRGSWDVNGKVLWVVKI